jgi:hydrogenase nickel incorporation protein HypA/HybF
MHELSIAESLIEQVVNAMKREGASKISSITVDVGVLSGVDPEALQMGFNVASEGTLAQGAKLTIQKIEAKIFCKTCQKESVVEDFCFLCPKCGSTEVEMKEGRELKVREMEVV